MLKRPKIFANNFKSRNEKKLENELLQLKVFSFFIPFFYSWQKRPVHGHFKGYHPLLDVLKHLLDVRLLEVEVQSSLVLPQGEEVDLDEEI